MPVVRIAALPQEPGVDLPAVLAVVTEALAAVLGEEPSGTWATWETIEPARYSEGGDAPLVQPRHTHPPLVTLTAFEGRSPEVVAQMLETVAAALVRELGLGEGNVFATYQEARSGQVYSGGRVLSRG